MIRRSFTAIGQTALFFIGTDKAIKRFVESIDFDAPVKRYPIEDPYAKATHQRPYRRPLWLKVEKRLDAWRRSR